MTDPKLKQYEYFRTDLGVLYCGDCLEILPMLDPVDLVLTDPPYGIADKWKGGAGGRSSWRIPAEETHGWDSKPANGVDNIAISHASIIWGGNYYNLPPTRCWFIWDKKQPDTWTTGQAELAWTNIDRPIRVFRMCQAEAHTEIGCKVHPSQKPVSLIVWCIEMSRISGIVLDPFLGSGTTAVACEQLGRRWIGIEISEKYCEIAKQRIERERQQLKLFPPKDIPKPKQESLF